MLAGKLTISRLCLAIYAVLGAAGLAQAETAGNLGVKIMLRTFSETVTADQRCTHSGTSAGSTLRIHCPAAVDVQAIARASASKTGQTQRMNAPSSGKDSLLAVIADSIVNYASPIELLISW